MCLIISRREQTLVMCFTPSAPTLLLLLLLFIISTRQHENKNRCCFVSPFCLTIPLCLLLLAGSSSSSQVSPQTPRRRMTLASLHPNQRRRLVWFNCTIRRRNPLRNGFKSTKRRRHDFISLSCSPASAAQLSVKRRFRRFG